jgi:hypothetical protein
VINMGVGKDQAIDASGIKTQVLVPEIGFLSAFISLKQAAIQQNALAVFKGYQVLATGYFAGCSKKLNIHTR